MTLIKAAVTFNGLTKLEERPTMDMIHQFIPHKRRKDEAKQRLVNFGFSVTSESDLTVSIQGGREVFEELYKNGVRRSSTIAFGDFPIDGIRSDIKETTIPDEEFSDYFWSPIDLSEWNHAGEWSDILDDVSIQLPYELQCNRFPKHGSSFPTPASFHHLRLPGDVAMTLNASKVHKDGITGNGIKVVMVDSGFNFKHHHFTENGYNVSSIPAANITNPGFDPKGHGTAMAANLLAVAPGVEFIGIKLLHDRNKQKNATLVEGLERALSLKPDIITLSVAFHLADRDNNHFRTLPNDYKAIEGLILLALSRGITVVCCVGNGLVGFPGMMPGVISVGGVFIDIDGEMCASDFTSAFTSKIYENRAVPDVCGLSGMTINEHNRISGGFIMSPVQKGIDLDIQGIDGDDEWAIVGGSSTATAQVAGVCALLLEKNPGLQSDELKIALQSTAREVQKGIANIRSNENKEVDTSSTAGLCLVDAFRALRKV